jgi:predicted transcriptional regulator
MKTDAPEQDIQRTIGILEEAGFGGGRIKIAYDEWNLRNWHHPWHGNFRRGFDLEARRKNDIPSQYTMADALFSACFLNACLRHADIVDIACFSPIVNTRGAIFVHPKGILKRTTYHVFDMYVNMLEDYVQPIVWNTERLEGNKAGFRTTSGTTLKDSYGNIIYTPPQDANEINDLMANLERFINDEAMSDIDPLIKIAIIHHQFESIHPFYDGNGRTGRILIILYLVANNLLDLPILYLSRYITNNKAEYYRLLQKVRDSNGEMKDWCNWILFILKGIEKTALDTIKMIQEIDSIMREFKSVLRPLFGKQYKHELINNLFFHPYTKIEFIQRDMQVSRNTASKYLEWIVEVGLLEKVKVGKTNYYFNIKLIDLFVNHKAKESSL